MPNNVNNSTWYREGPTRDRSMRTRLLKRTAQRVIKCKFTDEGKKKSHAVLSNYSQNNKADHIKFKLWKNQTKHLVKAKRINKCTNGI